MKQIRFTTRPLLLLLLVATIGLCAGCGKKFEQMSAQEIYDYGSEKFGKGKYSESVEAYEALIDIYPFSVYVAKAELGIADSYFHKKRYEEAIPSYVDYLDRHPTSEKVPHAIYHLGMCYYERKMAVDRDQTATVEASNSFHRLVTEYPKSDYYNDARTKLNSVRDDMAKRERYVAKFYFREKEYYASLRRYIRIIRNYPDTRYFEEALYYSALCYYELGEIQDAQKHVALLKSKFPEGRYVRKAQKLQEKLD